MTKYIPFGAQAWSFGDLEQLAARMVLVEVPQDEPLFVSGQLANYVGVVRVQVPLSKHSTSTISSYVTIRLSSNIRLRVICNHARLIHPQTIRTQALVTTIQGWMRMVIYRPSWQLSLTVSAYW